GALIDPSNADHSTTLVDSKTPSKQYGYYVRDGSGNSCETNDTQCSQYTLTATYEGTVNGASNVQKSNLD
ncbi:MAG TPA: hypothetical protein VN554_00290, partial [Verrucomicrobiae bacterium]|nr:hypothetical protein [Verrucomicrobiae bacterium]